MSPYCLELSHEKRDKMFHVKHFEKNHKATGWFMTNQPVNFKLFYWKKTRRQLYKSGSQQLNP